jgi:hypothetical protein
MRWRYAALGEDLVVQDAAGTRTVWRGRPDGHPVRSVLPVADASGCIVLLDYSRGPPGAFPNLIRCRPDGSVEWRAALPTTAGSDAYVRVSWDEGRLLANSWSGYQVVVDPDTGRITSSTFTK